MPRPPIERSYYNPHIERLSREELLGLQWKRLKSQLEFTYHASPFHHKLFQQAKLTPESIKSMEDFRRLPLSDKSVVLPEQAEHPPFGRFLGVGEGKLSRVFLTSGTSGKGQEVMGATRSDLELEMGFTRGFYWAGLRRGDLAVHGGPTSLGPSAGMDNQTQAYLRLGVNMLHLGITYSTEQKIHIMKRFNPHFISMASRRMMVMCQEMDVIPRRDFPRLKAVMGFLGEGLDRARELKEVEEFWDARIHGVYGCTEGRNALGFTCEDGFVVDGRLGMYHLMEDRFVIEVLDRETREPVRFGEEGEVVITPLMLEASPVLRFALNDRAVLLPPSHCPCGRPFAGVEVGSIHRYDDMMKIRAMNFWPSAADGVISPQEEVAEYQARVWISQNGYEEITVFVEFKQAVPEERRRQLIPRLATQLKDTTGLRMEVRETSEALPRFDWKARRWRDDRRKGPTPQAQLGG